MDDAQINPITGIEKDNLFFYLYDHQSDQHELISNYFKETYGV